MKSQRRLLARLLVKRRAKHQYNTTTRCVNNVFWCCVQWSNYSAASVDVRCSQTMDEGCVYVSPPRHPPFPMCVCSLLPCVCATSCLMGGFASPPLCGCIPLLPLWVCLPLFFECLSVPTVRVCVYGLSSLPFVGAWTSLLLP